MRRKPPRLPASAFSPPNSGTSDRFPLAPSPSTVHPESVVDAHVVLPTDGDLDLGNWKKEAGQVLGGRIGGVVLSLEATQIEPEVAVSELQSRTDPILAISIPFNLDAAPPSKDLPTSKWPICLSTTFTKSVPDAGPTLKWALQHGRVVDVDVQCDITQEDASWEALADLLTQGTSDLPRETPIVLSNILPPPCDLTLPIVKLINHPSYVTYQSHITALSLIPKLHVKFIPPGPDLPASPAQISPAEEEEEWKKRIKMYLGPVLEAFGYERIIFGSSPAGVRSSSSPSSSSISHVGAWYEMARESFAELAVEQEAIDGVFFANAKRVYGS